MTNAQLLILLLVPIAFNGFALMITVTPLSNRVSSLESRMDHGFELLTGKVVELSDRLARVEERLEHR